VDNDTSVERIGAAADPVRGQREASMKTAEDVAEMLRLKACGWGVKRIASHLGCSHHTVKSYLAAGGVGSLPFRVERDSLI
jgi:DNA-binding NarL/FixJ family response regulator